MMLAALFMLTAASGVSADEEDKVVCRREQSEVGTHMRPKKTCMKQSDWDLVERHTRNKLQSINQRGNNPGRAEAPR